MLKYNYRLNMLWVLGVCMCVVTSLAQRPIALEAVWNRTIGDDTVTFIDGAFSEHDGECPTRRDGDPLSISRGSRLRHADGSVVQTAQGCTQACVAAGDQCWAARFVAVPVANDRCWRYTEHACQRLSTVVGCTFYRRVGCLSCQIAEDGNIQNDDRRANCILPFYYNGEVYEECSTANIPRGQTWCPTNSAHFIPDTQGYEYGICSEALRDQRCPACVATYDRMNATLYLDGERQDDISSRLACERRCSQPPPQQNDFCYGFDYDREPDECYLHLNPIQESRKVDNAEGVDHFRRRECEEETTTRQPGGTTPPQLCDVDFTVREDTGLHRGVEQLVTGRQACEDACLDNEDCVAFNVRTSDGTCWLVVSGTVDELTTFENTNLISYIRNDCPVVGSTPDTPDCTDTFHTREQERGFGGNEVARVIADTAVECRVVCLSEPSCRSFDFDYLTIGPACYWFDENEFDLDLFPVATGARIDHFIRDNCTSVTARTTEQPPVPCTEEFERIANTGAQGGVRTPEGTTVQLCRRQCQDEPLCVGFDFAAQNPSTQRCFLHSDRERVDSERYRSEGVDLYVRLPCATGPGTVRTTPDVCMDSFDVFDDTNSQNAVWYSGGTTRAQCEDRCLELDIEACAGYDWDAANTQRCWIHTNNTIENSGRALGVTQYRRRDCGIGTTRIGPDCIDEFRTVPNFAVRDGTPTLDRTVASCRDSCLESRLCQGFNFVRSSQAATRCTLHIDTDPSNNLLPSQAVDTYIREACEATARTTPITTSIGPVDNCVDQFNRSPNTLSYGGRELENAGTVALCSQACRQGTAGGLWRTFGSNQDDVFIFNVDDCIGFDLARFTTGSICYIHTDNNLFENFRDTRGTNVDQYTRIRCDVSSTIIVPTQPPRPCVNRAGDGNCNVWASNNDCNRLTTWMNENCYKSCSSCDSAGTTEAPVGVCDGPYRRIDDTNIPGGTLYTAIQRASLQQCKVACENKPALPACVAFEYRASVNFRCTHHTDADDLAAANRTRQVGTDLYVFDDRCGARPLICDGPYEIIQDMYALGGSPYQESPQATLEQCKLACEGSELCVAFDYSESRTPFCWRHFDSDNLNNMRDLTANNQYRFNEDCGERPPPGSECIGHFFEFEDMNAIGAQPFSNLRNLEACLMECERDSDCTAIDYDAVGSTRCWLHMNDVRNDRRPSSTGVNHYELVRRCNEPFIMGLVCDSPHACACAANQTFAECGSACNQTCDSRNPPCTLQCVRRCQCPPPAPFQAADGLSCLTEAQCDTGCVDSFEVRRDTHAFGGERVGNANTLAACRRACSDDPDCLAVDWDAGNDLGQRCYMHTVQDNVDDATSSPGVEMHVINRMCDGSTTSPTDSTIPPLPIGTCSGPYRVFNNVYARDGTPYNQDARATLQECRQECDRNMDCVAFEHSVSREPRCWHHMDVDNLRRDNIVALLGEVHYRFDSTCGARPTTEPVPCDEFEMFANTNAVGAESRGTRTLAQCMQLCRDEQACLALDYVRASNSCWLHLSAFVGTFDNDAVDHYEFDRCEVEPDPCQEGSALRDGSSVRQCQANSQCPSSHLCTRHPAEPRGACCDRLTGSRCHLQLQQIWAGDGALIGAFVPDCETDGSFNQIQCHGSTGQCWCVDNSGNEVDGTRRLPGQGQPICEGPCEDVFVLNGDMKADGAQQIQGSFTLSQCQRRCVNNAPECFAIDYVRSSGGCWLHTSRVDQNDLTADDNVDHYTLVGRCDPLCQLAFIPYANSDGGRQQDDYTSVQECFEACVADSLCEGAEFDVLRGECFFHNEDSVQNEQFSDCCYRMTKSCDNSCQETAVAVLGRRGQSGGTLLNTVNSRQQCQQECFNSGCDVFEYSNSGNVCRIYLNMPLSDIVVDNSYSLYRRVRCVDSIDRVPYL